jgi:hypothetical protein
VTVLGDVNSLFFFSFTQKAVVIAKNRPCIMI